MTPKNIKVKHEERSGDKDYLKKAEDNYNQMLVSINVGNFNAAGTLAIQCAISSADAICVSEKGVRCVSDNHLDTCDLVGSIALPEAKEKANILMRIIRKKNLIQYEKRSIYQSEAEEIVKAATRFYQWVASQVK